jgi:hypothetical protein
MKEGRQLRAALLWRLKLALKPACYRL